MAQDDSLEIVNHLRHLVEARFLSLNDTSTDNEERNVALERYRELRIAIRQLEKLEIPVHEALESEKVALEEFLHRSSEDESELVFLSKELSSLAKDISYRLRNLRSQKSSTGKKGPRKRLRVEFSDGTIIEEPTATDTFVDAIRHMGLQCVSELPIKKNGVSLVSIQEPELPSRMLRKKEGYFINIHSSTDAKGKYIQRIADALRVDVSISVVD